MSSSSNPIMLLFRTVGEWGAGIARNLTPAEVDENFYTLQRYVNFLHDNPTQPTQIDSISVSGDQMTFNMDDGSTFGPFTLPSSAFVFTGDFQAIHGYSTFDLLIGSDGGLYMVLQSHTSAATFSAGAANSSGPYYQLLLPAQTLYDIGFFFPGTPGTGITAGNAMFTFRFTRNVYLPADCTGSYVGVGAAPTADVLLAVYKNSIHIGDITIAASSLTGTFAFPTHTQFTAGDRLRVLRPASLDATAYDLSLTFKALKGTFEGESS